MSASLVGSEMCIRDSCGRFLGHLGSSGELLRGSEQAPLDGCRLPGYLGSCLLYTSDAADDM
eukprot:6915670-Alexandrium_andersonii.AAC.1